MPKGIGNDDTVVLYGGNNNWFAAYAYWYFTLYGHADVKLLDGGRKKWELDGRALTTDETTRDKTSYAAQEQNLSIRAFRDETIAAIGKQNLVDVRSPDEFSGKLLAPAHLPQEQSQRAGHIPTALNVPWSKAANDDGTFKSDEELRELYARAWTRRSRPSPTAASASGEPHLVRAARAARREERQELRRLVDRVRLPGRRAGREGRLMCGAPAQELPQLDVGSESVVQGIVSRGGSPLRGAYVRLLDASGEFTAEVQTSANGVFRFYAAPGDWTLRTLATGGASVDTAVTAAQGLAPVTAVEVPA